MAKLFEVTYLKYNDAKLVRITAPTIAKALEKGQAVTKKNWGDRVKSVIEIFDAVEVA